MTHYILNKDKIPVEVDLMTWAEWFGDPGRRRVALTRLGKTRISTVFLGLDHRFGPGEPLLFETMIFDTRWQGYQDRYCTYQQALAGHRRAVYHVSEQLRAGALSSTSRNAREGRYLVRRARAMA
jgi:hypothetical protein